MEDRQLEARESFDLINRMIANTRSRMERNAGRPFLIWGYLTVLFTLLVWFMVVHFQDPRWNCLWVGLPVAGGLGMFLTRPRDTEGKIYTFVDRVISHVWMVVGLAAFFTMTLSMLAVARPPMLFLILLMMGMGTTITGLVIRFTPVMIGGFISIVMAPLMLAVTGTATSALLFIAGFVVMMIVPGHILNWRSNHPEK